MNLRSLTQLSIMSAFVSSLLLFVGGGLYIYSGAIALGVGTIVVSVIAALMGLVMWLYWKEELRKLESYRVKGD